MSIRFAVAEAATRRALADLDEHLLRDIGATQRDATTQGHPPPWFRPHPLA